MTSNRCGNIELVPFTPHPLGADYIPRFDAITEAPLDVPDIGSIYYDPTKHSTIFHIPQLPSNFTMLRGNMDVAETPEFTLVHAVDICAIGVGVMVILLVVRRLIIETRTANKAL